MPEDILKLKQTGKPAESAGHNIRRMEEEYYWIKDRFKQVSSGIKANNSLL
jgi:hypothetical protein